MDWKNVNLEDNYERDQNLLDSYCFDTLLLEVSCNIKDINEATIKAQAMEAIKRNYETAIEILNANLTNLTKKALSERDK